MRGRGQGPRLRLFFFPSVVQEALLIFSYFFLTGQISLSTSLLSLSLGPLPFFFFCALSRRAKRQTSPGGKKKRKENPHPTPLHGDGGERIEGIKVEDARAARPFTAGELKIQGE